MDVNAKLRFLRISPTKVRLVVNAVRGLAIEEAEQQLQFMNKRPAEPVLKLLRSAIANAENNFKLKKDNLFIKKITVDDGPTLKRWRPRAYGRAGEIRKRSSHILLVLGEKAETLKADKKLAAAKKSISAESKEKEKAGIGSKAKKGAIVKKAAEKKKKETQPVVSYDEIKHDARGKEEKQSAPGEQKKHPLTSFRGIKERFSRKLGDR